MASTAGIDFSVKILKVLAYIFIFGIVLGSAVVSKGTLLFITSQLKKGKAIIHCNRQLGESIFLKFFSYISCCFFVESPTKLAISSRTGQAVYNDPFVGRACDVAMGSLHSIQYSRSWRLLEISQNMLLQNSTEAFCFTVFDGKFTSKL